MCEAVPQRCAEARAGIPNQSQSQRVEPQAVLIESKLRLAFDFDEIRPGHPGCGRDDWKTRISKCAATLGNLEPWPYVHKGLLVFVCMPAICCECLCLVLSPCMSLHHRMHLSFRVRWKLCPKLSFAKGPPIGPCPKSSFHRSLPPKMLWVSVSNDSKLSCLFFLSAQTCEKKIPVAADLLTYMVEIGSMSQNFGNPPTGTDFWPNFHCKSEDRVLCHGVRALEAVL